MFSPLVPSPITTRDPKGQKFLSIVDAAYNKAMLLSEDEAQRVNDAPGLSKVIADFIAANRESGEYMSEEDRRTEFDWDYEKGWKIYDYPAEYANRPPKFSDQIDILRSYWPNLNPDKALRYVREVYPFLELPEWIERPFAFIRPSFFSNKYGEEVDEVLKALGRQRQGRFDNYIESKTGSQFLRQSARTSAALAQIVAWQPNSDIVVVPGHAGIHHFGRSVRRALAVFDAREFAFGAKDGVTMVLTNPARIQRFNDSGLKFGGDEFNDQGRSSVPFNRTPYLDFSVEGLNKLRFGTGRVDNLLQYIAVPSGLVVPQK